MITHRGIASGDTRYGPYVGVCTDADCQCHFYFGAAVEAAVDELEPYRKREAELANRVFELESKLEAAVVARDEWNHTCDAFRDENKELKSRLDQARKAVRDRLIASGHGSSVTERTLDEWFGVVERQTTNDCGARHVDGMTRVHECTLPKGHDGWHGRGLFAWPQ